MDGAQKSLNEQHLTFQQQYQYFRDKLERIRKSNSAKLQSQAKLISQLKSQIFALQSELATSLHLQKDADEIANVIFKNMSQDINRMETRYQDLLKTAQFHERLSDILKSDHRQTLKEHSQQLNTLLQHHYTLVKALQNRLVTEKKISQELRLKLVNSELQFARLSRSAQRYLDHIVLSGADFAEHMHRAQQVSELTS